MHLCKNVTRGHCSNNSGIHVSTTAHALFRSSLILIFSFHLSLSFSLSAIICLILVNFSHTTIQTKTHEYITGIQTYACYLLALPFSAGVHACTLHLLKPLQDKNIPNNVWFSSPPPPSELRHSLCQMPALWICLIHPDALLQLGASFTTQSPAAAEQGHT